MWGTLLALTAGVLFAFYPTFMPDDINTVKRFMLVAPYVHALAGTYDMSLTKDYGDFKADTTVKGSFEGSLSKGFRMNSSFTDTSVDAEGEKLETNYTKNVYMDVVRDILYVNKSDRWFAYSNAVGAVDSLWWANQIVPSSFTYEGHADTPSGKSSTVLVHTYSGSDVASLFDHLHITFDGDLDTTDSDVLVAVYIHPIAGILQYVSVQSSETGYPLVVRKTDGSSYTITSFHLGFDVVDYKSSFDMSLVQLPNTFSEEDIVPVTSDLVVADVSHDTVQERVTVDIPDGAIYTSDGLFAVGFDASGVFDQVEHPDNVSLSVTSSQTLTGQPHINIYFRDKLDAYSAAKSDAVAALLYYDKAEDISEVYVNTDLLASYIAGHPAYMYLSQYTDTADGFVNIDYCVYIELTKTQYVRVVISSLVDVGINTVLTDDYAYSILKHLWIMDLHDVQVNQSVDKGVR